MTFKEILEKLKTEGDPEILLAALEQVSQACSNAAADAQKASNAYYADSEAKQRKIKDRVEELKTQLEECEAKVEALKKPLVSATVSGDNQQIKEVKDRMKAQELERMQLTTEIDMLTNAHITGNEDLYDMVVEKNNVYENLRKDYVSAKAEAHKLAGERIKGYEKIQNRAKHFYAGGGNGPDMDALDKHFFHEKHEKLKKEADQL